MTTAAERRHLGRISRLGCVQKSECSMSDDEIWKVLPLYGGHYEVSNMGRIRAKDRIVRKFSILCGKDVDQKYKGRLLTPRKSDKYGHLSVTIGYERRNISLSIHRAVLLAFVGPCPEGMEGCHNNGNASDNRLENLRWDTHAANNADRKRHGRYAENEAHPMVRYSDEIVKAVRSSGLGPKKAAQQFGMSVSQAHRIIRGESRK